MATIQSGGIGSGIDVNTLITELVAAERAGPETILNTREDETRATITALGSLRNSLESFSTKLESLQELNTLQARSATSGDTSIFTATADNTASVGSYTIEVLSYAQAHKLSSGDFASSSTEVGQGTLTIQVGADSFDIAVSGSNDTVSQLRDAINEAEDNTGVTASIVNVDDGMGGTVAKLLLTADDTGTDNELTITITGDTDGNDTDNAGLSQLLFDPNGTQNLTEINAVADAQIKIDGNNDLVATSSSNTIEDVIQGVTINLLQSDVGNAHTLTIAKDTTTVKDNIKSFISSYNDLAATLNLLGNTDEDEGNIGALVGDATLRTLQSQIRQAITSPVEDVSSAFNVLASIGITSQKDGSLLLDESELDEVLDTNFDDVGLLFASDSGYANTLEELIDSYTETNGLLDSRNSTLNTQLDDIAARREALDLRIEKFEARILEQFTAMDILVSNLKSTGDFLTQQFAQLAGNNSNN